jgi:hypothetical protein
LPKAGLMHYYNAEKLTVNKSTFFHFMKAEYPTLAIPEPNEPDINQSFPSSSLNLNIILKHCATE